MRMLLFFLITLFGVVQLHADMSFSRVNGSDHPFPVINMSSGMPFQSPDYTFSFEAPNVQSAHQDFYPEYSFRLMMDNYNTWIFVRVNISLEASTDPFIRNESVHIPHDEYFKTVLPQVRQDQITGIEMLNVGGCEVYHISFDRNIGNPSEHDTSPRSVYERGDAYTFVRGERRYSLWGFSFLGIDYIRNIMDYMVNSVQFSDDLESPND